MLPPADASPTELGGFTLLERIGAGGMGEVWLAERRAVGGVRRRAAIKRILARHQNDATLRERFIAEARITARLEHPNIVQVLDFGDTPELYLALEYLEGVSVADLLKHASAGAVQLPLEATLFILAEAASGLDYAHERVDDRGHPLGIIHRDVSPSNILLSTTGAVKISDFGIARAADNVVRTDAGLALGKLVYMAPEQALGGAVDRRVDVWALGVCLWEMLVLHPLIPRNDMQRALVMLHAGNFVAPSAVARAPVSPTLDAIVATALQVNVEGRTLSAGVFARSLRAVLASIAPGYGAHDLAPVVLEAMARTRLPSAPTGIQGRTQASAPPPALAPPMNEGSTRAARPAHPNVGEARPAMIPASEGLAAAADARPPHASSAMPRGGEMGLGARAAMAPLATRVSSAPSTPASSTTGRTNGIAVGVVATLGFIGGAAVLGRLLFARAAPPAVATTTPSAEPGTLGAPLVASTAGTYRGHATVTEHLTLNGAMLTRGLPSRTETGVPVTDADASSMTVMVMDSCRLVARRVATTLVTGQACDTVIDGTLLHLVATRGVIGFNGNMLTMTVTFMAQGQTPQGTLGGTMVYLFVGSS